MKEYYGIVDEEKGWAVMSHNVDDASPPVLVFEDKEIGEKYRRALGLADEWMVWVMDDDDLEMFANDAGDRLMLVTSVKPGHIRKREISLAELRRRAIDAN